MTDPRYTKLADTLIRYSCDLQTGERVLIEAIDIPVEFTRELIRAAYRAEGLPLVLLKSQPVMRELLMEASAEQLQLIAGGEEICMRGVDAYIGMRGSANVSELSDVPMEKMRLYEEHIWKPVHVEVRVSKTKWVVSRWPSPSMAQLAQRSTHAFEDFYFQVCTMDYERLSEAIEPLREIVEATDAVRLVGPGTDLTFSIEGIPAISCDGHRNLPDGEVYTAPVRDSVNGTIRFNAETLYQGVTHDEVCLTFEDGRITDAASSNTDHLQAVLDSDEGARYVGEFAIGLNPYITEPMKDILFDEKIAGSIHLTPGGAYEIADNGNRSQIHWDLVLIQTPDWGGGELWFDGRLIRKDGRFVLEELSGLNPENLVG
ncbi:MAG: aminopeptidase [Gemmatimonadota bacterium]|jgi:aminopeptidase|nr:MAG: aminopeptidase [Gemmatimonadota bacterium]